MWKTVADTKKTSGITEALYTGGGVLVRTMVYGPREQSVAMSFIPDARLYVSKSEPDYVSIGSVNHIPMGSGEKVIF